MNNHWPVILVAFVLLAAAACVRVTPALTGITPQPTQAPAILEPEQSEVWHRPRGQDEREVEHATTAGQGDRVWTERRGRALLMWKDLWVRLYDDTKLHVDECQVLTDICLAMGFGTVLNGGVPRARERITWTTTHAEIRFTGTTVMAAYHPGSQLTIVRVFDGQVKVRNLMASRDSILRIDDLMGLGRAEIVDAREWALVEPDKPPQVSDQLEEMRSLARELGLWDAFH